ncbi:GLPGLI family protein [Aquimarina muelleri]|uniref:GLPGLI family protein n=1 Tax=Aquimarina muelleri TaxID=279356 RepID=UPI003F682483
MKYLPLLIVFYSCLLHSQKGIVYYGQITSPGMKSPAGPDLNSFLVFDKKESYYVTAKDSLEKSVANQKAIYTGSNDQQVAYNGDKTFRYGKQVYYDRKKDSMWWSQRFRGNIYVSEKRPTIKWKLEKETKKIGNFKTYKAVGEFRGRTYTAWYILEVPLPYGPWKLQGLPGLILEAYDEKKEMYLYFKSLEYPTENKAIISKVQREKGDPEGWKSIQDFEDMLRNSIKRAYNRMVLRAEKKNKEKPNKPIFNEIYIESF